MTDIVVPAPTQRQRTRRLLGVPATAPGRWAVGLAAGFALCLMLNALLPVTGWWAVGTGLPLLFGLLAPVFALAGVLFAAFAVVFQRERSALLLLPLLPVALVVAFIVGETTGDHATDEAAYQMVGWEGSTIQAAPAPVLLAPGQPLGEAAAVAAGQQHSLALRRDGTVWAWGNNRFGQLGDGGTASRDAPAPVLLAPGQPLGDVTAIAARLNHSLALTSDGVVWAWGENNHGVLGDGTTERRATPVRVGGLGRATAISTGTFFSLALAEDGTVWAWGDNRFGQLGDGSTDDRHAPVRVAGLAGVAAVAAGGDHGLALLDEGTVHAWGANHVGQLGDGTTTGRRAPGRVNGLGGVTALAASGGASFAVTADGAVWSWGEKGGARYTTTTDKRAPDRMPELPAVSALASSTHALALGRDGTVWAWGGNGSGQLGDGTTALVRLAPAPVLLAPGRPLAGAVAVAAENGSSLALADDGTVWAWGVRFWWGDGQ